MDEARVVDQAADPQVQLQEAREDSPREAEVERAVQVEFSHEQLPQ